MCAAQPPSQSDSPLPLPPQEPSTARVQIHARLPRGTKLRVALELLDSSGQPLERRTLTSPDSPFTDTNLEADLPASTQPGHPGGLRALGGWLGLSLALYLLVRLIGLADYPIYFFTDEAVQTVLAADFIRDGFQNYDREVLPTYFKNVYQYNLGVSVYLQIIPLQLFGKSVEVTRGVNVLFSLLAAACVGLAFRRFFRSRYPWLAVLVLSATPAWFLHSRTAFETSLAVSFYAGFIYCYMLYRAGQPRAIYAALGFGALSFYSYSPAQMVLAFTTLLLLISDYRYHWQQRRTLARAALLGLLLALPYLRFQMAHPEESLNHLRQIGSYWLQPISPAEKLERYLSAYLQGLNPIYWLSAPTTIDLERHIMNGYGHLLRYLFPFGLLGLWIAFKNGRHWAYRLLLITAAAAPSGAALVELGITRALFMVIPAALITALGISAVMEWVIRRARLPRPAVVLAFGLLLAGFNIFLLADSLLRGGTWSTNYTLSGMQYGARQVFRAALDYTAQNPQARLVLSPTWANGTDVLARFFLPEDAPLELRGVDGYVTEIQPIDEHTVFILPPDELQRALESRKFTDPVTLRTVPAPNGEVGFYFVKMRYVDNIKAIFAAEWEDRRAMVTENLTIGGEPAVVRHSRLDMGQIRDFFDANPDTMARGMAANPLHLQIEFLSPRELSALVLRVGSAATTFEISLQVAGETKPRLIQKQLEESSVLRDFEIPLGSSLWVDQVYIKIKNTNDPEPAHVHLWEVTFK